MRDDGLGRLSRRALTVPAVFVATSVAWSLAPVLLLGALAFDLLSPGRRSSLASVRLAAEVLAMLTIESAGLVALFGVWAASLGRPDERRRLTAVVQGLYTRAHFEVVRNLFSLRFEVTGAEAVARGPMLLFVRHASIIDTLLPGVFVTVAHGIELRYVLKRELLWGPCLDVAGHFLRNHFVDRSGVDSARELAAVRALGEGLGPREGVVLYPEGTRFSRSRRKVLLDKSANDPAARTRVESLEFLLPVRAGGALALFDAAKDADVVVVAHTGLEGFAKLADVWAGDLVGRTIRLEFKRIPASSIPPDEAGRRTFLDALWRDVDGWIRANRAA